MQPGSQHIYEFGPFRVDGAERTLLRDGAPIALTDKVFELLWLLVQNRGRVMTKAELMQALWPDTVVEENNLTVNMSTLRKALGESAGQRRYIETLSRRGYRFVADVHETAPLELPPIARHTPTFVGRELELARLVALLERARGGQGRVVFIDGDPGMGKTELAEQFLAVARSEGRLIIAQGRCLEQFGTGEAYLPFLEASRSLLLGRERARVVPLFRQHAPTWLAQFGSASALAGGGEALRGEAQGPSSARMLREMGDALEALSALEPVVLLLEDMHWADPSSSDLLRLLGQRAMARRLLVLATLRRSEVDLMSHPLKNVRRELLAHQQCEELELPLLDRAAIGRYIDARFQPHALPAELAELVVRKTEGHPLFATRLIQMLVERGDVQQVGGAWRLPRPLAELELGVPSSVRGLILKKLDSLDEDDRRALQYASVLGVEFSTSALAHLLEVDEVIVDEWLHPLARAHHLLEPLGEKRAPSGQLSLCYRFAHVLYQNVLSETLASKRRMVLHQRAAEHLLSEQGGDAWRVAAQLAVHFEAARDYDRAIGQLIIAGDNAGRLLANREAKQHYAHALELVNELPAAERAVQNLILRYNHGWAAFNQYEVESALSDFETMLALARSPELTEACELAGSGVRGDTEATLRFQLAAAHAARGDDPLARAELVRAERLIGVAPAGPDRTTAPRRRTLRLEMAQAQYRIASGEPAAAEGIAQRLLANALARGSRKHVASARLLLAQAALGLSRPDSAKQHAAAGLAALEQHPIPLIAWRLHAVRAAALRQTDASGADSALARALELLEQIERGIDDERLREHWRSSREVRALRACAPMVTAGIPASV